MFYTKYRPQKFSDLENLEAVKRTLLSQLKNNKVGHAYLFYGPKGTGKTTTARLLAKALNCPERGKKGDPCGGCKNCQAIFEGRFIDLIEIDAASNRGIDDIRSLKERVVLSPVIGPYKIYIIDEVHMLTKEAFNALLKTLEEPPKHIIFILCTTEFHKVPKTIVSRCQKFRFSQALISNLLQRLKKICEQESVSLAAETLKKIAQAASGGYRDAETILEQVISGQQSVENLLGLLDRQGIISFLEAVLAKDARLAFLTLDRLVSEGEDLEYFTKAVIEYLRSLLLTKIGVGDELLDISKEELEILKSLTQKLHESEIEKMITLFTQSLTEIGNSPIPQLPIEVAIVRYSFEEAEQKNKPEFSGKDKPQETETENKEPAPKEKCPPFLSGNLQKVKENWAQILKTVKPYNHSIEALLRSCRPFSYSEGVLTIEAFYKFHKNCLDNIKNKELLEKVTAEVLEEKVVVRCVLGKNKLEAIENYESGIDIFTSAIEAL